MQRRTLLTSAAMALLFGKSAFAAAPAMEVFKDAQCGCCTGWIEHLQANGFAVTARNVDDTGVYRRRYGMLDTLRSCHTGRVAGYTIEGHVPAREIHQLLKQRPQAIGLVVPGMPMGSPGMEGKRNDAYDVLLVQADGRSTVYRHYPA